MTDLAPYAATVTAIGPDAPSEQIVAAIVLIDGLVQRAKELKAELEAAAVEWIKANGEFAVGDVRYYVGTPKVVKCRDVRATVEAILVATGGDLDRLASCLAASPLKQGTVRKLLDELGVPEKFGELFDESRGEELAEGKLQKADPRFAKMV